MRGKEPRPRSASASSGITPAYAGKSSAIFVPEKALEDHPRLCGEKNAFDERMNQRIGSPPPMRGKGGVKVLSATERRITPAYAGKRQKIS